LCQIWFTNHWPHCDISSLNGFTRIEKKKSETIQLQVEQKDREVEQLGQTEVGESDAYSLHSSNRVINRNHDVAADSVMLL
jgi:hypothetical protein